MTFAFNFWSFIYSLAILLVVGNSSISCKDTRCGYYISVEVQNANESIYLKKYQGKSLITIDSTTSKPKLKVIFSGNSFLESGMYAIGFKRKEIINFFISNFQDQKFKISLDIENPTQTLKVTGSPENQAFVNYIRFLEIKQKQQLTPQIQQELNIKQNELEKIFSGSTLALFIHSTREPKMPEPKIPQIIINREQAAQEYYYKYMQNHFFDNIDFSDIRLLNMPVLEQNLGTYFRQLVPPQPDSLIFRIGMVLGKAKANGDVYNWTVRYLYQIFREAPIQGNTEVYNFIGENYILKEPERWNDAAFVDKVKNRISKAKLNPIGTIATNLKLQTPNFKTIDLYSVKSQFSILYFFNPGCDACMPITEALFKLYKENQSKGIQVFAVYMDKNKADWQNYIKTKTLDWINVYDPNGSAEIEQKYDIFAIPMIYLLDKDKKVIAKDVPVGELKKYF